MNVHPVSHVSQLKPVTSSHFLSTAALNQAVKTHLLTQPLKTTVSISIG